MNLGRPAPLLPMNTASKLYSFGNSSMVSVLPTTALVHVHAQRLQVLDLRRTMRLGRRNSGNAVHQHAARQMQGLEHRDRIAFPRQLARAAQARGRADHRTLWPLGADGRFSVALALCQSATKRSNCRCPPARPLMPQTQRLALAFLRADTAADRGQRRGAGKNLIRALEIPFSHLVDKGGNVDTDLAAAHAGLLRQFRQRCASDTACSSV